ncbi:uncharacterized protein TNCV_669201 [Trichonephila clavipes]|nr:uncharacterized protein TNCV_669201 [Trichonephila clavipes]
MFFPNIHVYGIPCMWNALCGVPSQYRGTINSRISSREVGGRGREVGGRLTPPGVFPQNWGGNEPKHTATCMVLKATANDRRHLALCRDEFRGSRSGLCRSGGTSNNNNILT